MSDDTPLTPEQEDDALAAELALGLLEGDEAKAAVERLSTDPQFAQAVRDWQERLAGMADGVTPVMPPARAWQNVRERLGHGLAPLTEVPGEGKHPWWRGPFGLLAGLAAAAAVGVFLWLPNLPSSQPEDSTSYQVELVSEDESLRVSAMLAGREIQVVLQDGAAPTGRDYEIWWIAPDGSAPISLGLVPQSGTVALELPEGLEPAEDIQIALSEEPEGGSQTGQATGPIVAAAELTNS